MRFEFRTFNRIPDAKTMFEQPTELLDIYIHKRGLVGIGIKIRNPKPKDYGWKMNSVECKILTTCPEIALKNPQLWYKFVIPCEYELRWLEIPKKQLHLEIAKLNKLICETLMAELKNLLSVLVSKNQTQTSQEYHMAQETVKRWCAQDISQVYFVEKIREKLGDKEFATIQAERYLNNREFFYFETNSEQHLSPDKFERELNVLNTSYPQLMQDMLHLQKGSSSVVQ